MNAFYERHQRSILFHYRCFDRLLLNALIQPFQQPERVIGFFSYYRQTYPVSRELLRDIAGQYHNWVVNRSQTWHAPILEAPQGRRDEFVAPHFRGAEPDRVVAILKAREPTRILVSIGQKQTQKYHLEFKQRWVQQYSFYLWDRDFGRMFIRVCPYFPFSARICLNQHEWLARRLEAAGVRFQQAGNAFLRCSDPERLQQLADSLRPQHLIECGQKWLTQLVPFFTDKERQQAGCQHRLFVSQIEFCDNAIFRRRAPLDALGERLLDANRGLGKPNKLTVIFGRKVNKRYRGKLQMVIEDLDMGSPVMRSHYKNGFIKQYVRDRRILRTEAASNNVRDYGGLRKTIEDLPRMRQRLSDITRNYLDVQQDILETFLDRGEMRRLSQPTILPNGRRIPGLKADHPRQLALMQALVRFSHIAAEGTFRTGELQPLVAQALGCSPDEYKLGSLRYDLWKLRAKGLVEKIPHSRRYRLLPQGYRLCVVFLKLFQKIYAPLTAGLMSGPAKRSITLDQTTTLDRLYLAVGKALDELLDCIGLKPAA